VLRQRLLGAHVTMMVRVLCAAVVEADAGGRRGAVLG